MKHERETLEAVIAARNAAVTGRAAPRRPIPATRGDAALAAGAAAADRRPGPPHRAGRELSRPQGQPEHDGLSGGADLHREQGRLRPPGIQRRGDELQRNNRRETFPGSVYAGILNFTPAGLLEIPPEHPEMRDAPRVAGSDPTYRRS